MGIMVGLYKLAHTQPPGKKRVKKMFSFLLPVEW